MKKRIVWVGVSCLVVLALLAASCAKAEEEAPAVKEKAPIVKEEAPIVKEEAPIVAPGWKTISLTKHDGTVVERLVEKPKYGGTLTMSRSGGILNWDEAFRPPWTLGPSLAYTNEELLITDWTRGPAGTGEYSWTYQDWVGVQNVVGSLAESWEFPDSETIIFNIRKGVRYALNPNSAASRLVGGREFNAHDAAFNIRRIFMEIATSTMYNATTAGKDRPRDVYAQDDWTVVIKTNPSYLGQTFEFTADWMVHNAPEVIQKYGDQSQWENVVGTGPFILTDYVPMSSATWVRNPNYWDRDPISPENQLPYVDGLRILIIPDLSTRLAALRTHKVDLDTGTYPITDAEPMIKSNPEVEYLRIYAGGCTLIGFRVDKPELPFKDIKVRRALLMAVNRQEIRDTYYRGDAELIAWKTQPVPPMMPAYTPLEELPESTRELFEYHPEKARQLLAEAGYPNGFKTEMIVNASATASMDIAQMVKAYWADIGVDVTIDAKESGTFTSILERKTHKEMLFGGRGSTLFRMSTINTGDTYNWAMCSDEKADDYFRQNIEVYFDWDKRLQVMKEANLYFLSQAWYLVFPQPYVYAFWMPWVKNFDGVSSMGFYNYGRQFKYTWLDQELKKAMK